MNQKAFIGLIFLFIVGIFAAAIALGNSRPENDPHVSSNGKVHQLTAYKSATCGCCANWVGYMRTKGYKVDVVNTEEIDSIKEKYGVPRDLYACHTTIVNDNEYFIEGHIPEESISKLLEETPDISGIGMPGMPSGSPGMPGDKEPFNIMQVNKDGGMSLFEVI